MKNSNEIICHFFPDEKFTKRVVEFFDVHYRDIKHIFIIYNEDKNFYDGHSDNVYIVNNILNMNKNIYEMIKGSSQIVIHGFGSKQIIKFFNIHAYLLKKSSVVIWGGDLYNDFLFLHENRGLCLRLRIEILLKKRLMRKVPKFLTFTYSDYNFAQEWLGVNGKRYDCLYPSNLHVKDLEQIDCNFDKECDCINILVGNSATKTNNHFYAFDLIKHYNNMNIKVYCPLSYGDMEYGSKVEAYGKEIFGDKFIAIKEYMTIEDYSRFLSKMDVALFLYDRQQATANLEILGYFGTKVYLKNTCALWDHYVKRDNCCFFDSDQLKNSEFDDFIRISDKEKGINKKYFKKIWNDDYIKSLWDKALS